MLSDWMPSDWMEELVLGARNDGREYILDGGSCLVFGRQVAWKTRCLVRKILLGSVGATGLIVLWELRGSLDRVVVQVDRVDQRFPIFAQGPRLGSVAFSIYHYCIITLYD